MVRSVRVALMAVASLALLAAGKVPQMIAAEVATPTTDSPTVAGPAAPAGVQLASLTAPTLQLDAAVPDDETLAESDAARPSVGSLRELVTKISDLPSIDLDEEMRCLATAVYYESKGEPLEGQLAVAQVILNRRDSGRFASSLCGVVYQRGQFSFTWDGRPDRPADSAMWRTAQAIAVIAATDDWREIVPDATHFHARRVSPGWSRLQRVSAVGNHIFYRMR
jgi:spore germination cell wall hydrolase CwlJ-like protein